MHAEQPMAQYQNDPQPAEIADYTLPPYIDSTMIASFRSCHQKFYDQFIRNLAPIGSNIHLTAGGAFASGLQAARLYQFARSDIQRVDDLMNAAIGPLLRSWGDLEVDSEHPKNIHNVIYALELYLTEFHPGTDHIQPLRNADTSPTVEFTFAVPLPNLHPITKEPFIYVGRFDLLGRYRDSNLIVVVDEKTTGSLSSSWTRQWDMRGQFIGYVWACQQLGYTACRDAVVRGIGLYKTETKFLPVPVRYPQHLIDRWYTQLLKTIDDISFCFERNEWNYDFADACSSYGGCPFVDLCKHQTPDPWLSNFQKRTWTPIAAET